MRFTLRNGQVVTGDSLIEVPMEVYYPALMTTDASGEHVIVQPERVETQLFNMRVRDLTPAKREELFVQEVEEEPQPDGRFYFCHEDQDNPGKWISTPKDLEGLKAYWVQQINQDAGKILALSDWRVVKAVETGQPLSPQVSTFREGIRAYANAKQDAMLRCESLEDFISEVDSITWPEQEF